MLTAEEATERAKALASHEGWDLADYEDPVAEREGTSWIVRFEGREKRPGNHFVVFIDSTTGEAELWPGR